MSVMANEEREAILRMVAAGTVTVEQAAELLDAVDSPGPPPPRPGADLGAFPGELLSRNLGMRFGAGVAAPGPPGPPRPPRPHAHPVRLVQPGLIGRLVLILPAPRAARV